MNSGKSKIKNTFQIFLLCVLILAAAVLFLFVAQGQPLLRWVTNPSSAQAKPEPSSSVSEVSQVDISQVWKKDWQLLLVNNEYALPENYQIELSNRYNLQMDQRILEPYAQMVSAAGKDGITLWLSSAYRSVDRQKTLYEQEIKQNENQGLSSQQAEEKAKEAVALPGHSEHNTGLAIDLNGVKPEFENDAAYAWLLQHAEEYGFILRYPKEKEDITKIMFEPWHYRYVGPEHAKKNE